MVEVHDVLIIGAGPAGLAVAARLHESTPSALFTDAEHSRYQWLKKAAGRTSVHSLQRNPKQRQKSTPVLGKDHSGKVDKATVCGLDIKVLDSNGSTWMALWRKNFSALSITHLRSPMFFHPSPRDRDGLLAFAHETCRSHTCVEIPGCVCRSMSKHRRKKKAAKGHRVGYPSTNAPLEVDERDRKDYFTPAVDVFHDYCDEVVQRYCMEGLVEQAQIVSIDYDYPDVLNLEHVTDDHSTKLFRVETADHVVKVAKVVVLAVGSAGKLSVPRPLLLAGNDAACHSSQLAEGPFFAEPVKQRINQKRSTAVAVIGGGLTAAQIADKCIRGGVDHVYLMMRSQLRLKPFDIDLAWLSKYRNGHKAAFWSADTDEERFEMILQARNGGSMTATYYKRLQSLEACGCLCIHPHTSLDETHWDEINQSWTVQTQPPISNAPLKLDYIYYATGTQPDISQLPYLEPLRSKYPIKAVKGLPCLTDQLSWSDEVPCFVAGRLAGLRIGPDSNNLEGARASAERISWGVSDILEREKGRIASVQAGKAEQDAQDEKETELLTQVGVNNIYESLQHLKFGE